MLSKCYLKNLEPTWLAISQENWYKMIISHIRGLCTKGSLKKISSYSFIAGKFQTKIAWTWNGDGDRDYSITPPNKW